MSELLELIICLEKLDVLTHRADKRITTIYDTIVDRILDKLEITPSAKKNEEEKAIVVVAATPAQIPKRELIHTSPVAFGLWYSMTDNDEFPSIGVLPTKSPGVYEIAYKLPGPCPSLYGVLYVGQGIMRTRLQQHRNHPKKAFREYSEKGCTLMMRWYPTNTIEEAIRMEDHLLSTYDYACNEDGQKAHPSGRLFAQTYIQQQPPNGAIVLLSDYLLKQQKA